MTKEQLQADNERLGKEVAALRVLLTAVRDLADPPNIADIADLQARHMECARRLDKIAVWANPTADGSSHDVLLTVLHDRAKVLREDGARPLRYTPEATEPEPAPHPHRCKCGHFEAYHVGAVLHDLHPGQCSWDDDCGCQRYRAAAPAQAPAEVERCQKPGEHGRNLAGAVVDCDIAAHHAEALAAVSQ